MMGDRRKFPRTSKLLQVKVVSGTTVLQVMTTNISPTGAFFASSKILRSGEQVDVFIRPKGSKIPTVKLRAEVIREVHGGGTGQPGFAVRWLVAYSEVGRRPLVQFLRQVLVVPGIHEDLLPSTHFVEVQFPEVGAAFPFSSQRRKSLSTGPIRAASQPGKATPARSLPAGPRGAAMRVPIATKGVKQQAEQATPARPSVDLGSKTPSSPAPASCRHSRDERAMTTCHYCFG